MFPHRINRDGTIDSICSHCYSTIGTSATEADLERVEAAHVCEPERLRYYEEQRERAKLLRRNAQEVVSIKRVG